jgi:hypothetical protein
VQRVREDHASNLEEALRLYERVASFRTREVSPFDWAVTRNDVGTALAQNPDAADPARLNQAALAYRDALSALHPGGPATSIITVGWNLGQLGTQRRRWTDAVDGYQIALDAADARYRESLLLEARYDELTDMAGLRSELAAALVRQAGEAADGDGLLRRAVAVLENGRMQIQGELMGQHREQARLARLRAEHPDIYEDYLAKAERLREHENEQWREFQQIPSGQYRS